MRLLNYDIGNSGEVLASAILSLIFNGEVQRETLRGEGKGALDLQLKYPSFHGVDTTRQLAVQVKTGASYARWNQRNSTWVLQNIKPEHITKWQENNQPVILIWINPEKKIEIYWKFIGSNTSKTFLYLSKSHILTPASIFEIDRLVTISYKKVGGIPKINVKSFATFTETKKWARKEFSKIKGNFKTSIGDVTISNYVWRHLTRDSKNQSHIKDSLTILPYVKQILKFLPHQIQTTSQTALTYDNFTLTKRKVLLIYRNVKFNDIGTGVVYARFEEVIIYSKNWEEDFLINKSLQYSMKLESIYRKPS
jgi:hypothetical protein